MASSNRTPQHTTHSEDVESDVDQEIDQLDSDTDIDDVLDSRNNMPSQVYMSKGATNRGVVRRAPGTTLLPADKLEEILQAEGSCANMALSKEALFIISVATEQFIKKMVKSGHMRAKMDHRNDVNYNDMSYATEQYQELMFLQDFIPTPISLSDALLQRAQRQEELSLQDPALSFYVDPSKEPDPLPASAVPKPMPTSFPVPASAPPITKPSKGKSSSSATATNGKTSSAKISTAQGSNTSTGRRTSARGNKGMKKPDVPWTVTGSASSTGASSRTRSVSQNGGHPSQGLPMDVDANGVLSRTISVSSTSNNSSYSNYPVEPLDDSHRTTAPDSSIHSNRDRSGELEENPSSLPHNHSLRTTQSHQATPNHPSSSWDDIPPETTATLSSSRSTLDDVASGYAAKNSSSSASLISPFGNGKANTGRTIYTAGAKQHPNVPERQSKSSNALPSNREHPK